MEALVAFLFTGLGFKLVIVLFVFVILPALSNLQEEHAQQTTSPHLRNQVGERGQSGAERTSVPSPPRPTSQPGQQREATFAAGWYGDPWGQAAQRWWDGAQWTTHLQGPPSAQYPNLGQR